MKIGISTYSYNQYIRAGKMTALDTIAKAKEMGFPGIEIVAETLPQPITKEYLELIKDAAQGCGIELTAYLCGGNVMGDTEEEREAGVNKILAHLENANAIGTKLFRFDIGYSAPRYMSIDMAIERVAPYVKRVAARGEELGIMTMIENHGLLFQDWERVEKLYNAVNSKYFSLLVDIGNFMCADFDNVICVSKLANLASHVHAKDMKKIDFYDECSKEGLFRTRARNYLKGTYAGGGDAKVEQCIDILKAAGFDGYVDIEYEGQEDCIEGITKGYEFLKSIV